jgi:hypothetical protein
MLQTPQVAAQVPENQACPQNPQTLAFSQDTLARGVFVHKVLRTVVPPVLVPPVLVPPAG